VAQANKEKRAAQLHGMRSERELRGEMEAIERAARQALAQDRDDYAGMFVQVCAYACILCAYMIFTTM
jgi:hypothetical protein